MIVTDSALYDFHHADDYGITVKDFFEIKGFSQKIKIYFQNENYTVKTAASNEDVMDAIRLRTEIFLEELNNKTSADDFDIDEYDIYSDHLLLIDNFTGKVIGTYRLNSNLFSNAFYSEKEFDIYNIMTLPGIKVELGRACIKKEYRNGTILSLLWTGLIKYMKAIYADYLFGCSSVNAPGDNFAAQLYKLLKDSHFVESENLMVYPRKKYRIKDLDLYMMQIESSERKEYLLSQRFLPGLVKGYISAGAKICGEPIYDPDFHCYDYFTFLNVKQLDQGYVSRVTMS